MVVAQLIARPGAVNQGMAIAGAVVLALGSASIMLICEYLQGRATNRKPGVGRKRTASAINKD